MAEQKPGTVEPLLELEVLATEIPVAKSRAVEPFIKTFAFHPENVTQESLGTLVGVFSVSDRSESSAYTVNVIASVARKEYYANPRRGAIESFESTLHRINLALSELVKNGQTGWMGSLHGSIAVIEKRNIHFSATGNGGIFLFRDATIADIGDGLASEEAASHPLKTFLEISSGRLMPDDCVLLATPELFSLFSPRDLERNANRLLPERKFTRFLETAMINELRTGGAVVLDVRQSKKTNRPEPVTKRPKKRTTKPEPVNAWSEQAFRKAEEERTRAILESYDSEEDIVRTTKSEAPPTTNEIRIQGEALENADEHPAVTRLRWMMEDTIHTFKSAVARSARVARRKGMAAFDPVSEVSSVPAESRPDNRVPRSETGPGRPEKIITREQQTGTKPTEWFPKKPKTAPKSATHTPPIRNVRDIPSDRAKKEIRLPSIFRKAAPSAISAPRPESRFVKRTAEAYVATVASLSKAARRTKDVSERYAVPAIKRFYRFSRRSAMWAARRTAELGKAAWKRFLSLSQKQQIIISAVTAFLVTGLGIMLWKGIPEKRTEPTPVTVVEAPAIEPFPPAGEKNASRAEVSPLPMADQEIVAPVYLGNSLFIVTRSGVLDVSKNISSHFPASEGIRLAGGMEDLGLLFLLTDTGDLYSFAPGNRSFVKNAISFPSGFRVASIGDFLTYLYFLEEGTGRIYRFPRAEGGFGEGVPWTKTSLPMDTGHIAVSENIYGAGSTMTAYLRGMPMNDFALEQPSTPLSITGICANSDVPDRLVILDSPAKRIIIMESKGAIVSQLFDESFVSATACALSGDGTTVTVSGGTSSETVSVAVRE